MHRINFSILDILFLNTSPAAFENRSAQTHNGAESSEARVRNGKPSSITARYCPDRKWLTDNPGGRAKLPQNIAALGIDRREPTAHRSIEGDVAVGYQSTAPDLSLPGPANISTIAPPAGRPGAGGGRQRVEGGKGHFFGAQTKVARAGSKTGQ